MTKLYDPRDLSQRWDRPETWKECEHTGLRLIDAAIKQRVQLGIPIDDKFYIAALELIHALDQVNAHVEVKDIDIKDVERV